MLILLIDTTQKETYVALYQSKDIFEKKTYHERSQTAFLMPAIDKILKNRRISMNKIDLIGVNIGPGSYTGTRIGVITAKSLAYALDIPLVGFKTGTDSPIDHILDRFRAADLDNPKTLTALYNP